MNNIKSKSLTSKTIGTLALFLALISVPVMAKTPYSKIVTFGDSLTDIGNAYWLTGGIFPPSPPNAEGRIGNGPLWIEHLAAILGMELQPEDLYAVAGARSDTGNFNSYFEPTALENTGMEVQIAAYLQDSGPAGVDPTALHTIWIGPNDIFTTLIFGGEDMSDTVTHAVQNTAEAVLALAGNGARHILVVNLPDLGLTPFGLSQEPEVSAGLSYLTDAYNTGLHEALDTLEGLGIRTIRLNAAGLIREIVADPAAFSLVNVIDEASISGGDPDEYLFWNEVHPTSAGHKIVAQRAVEELVAFYSPRRGRGQAPGLVNSLKGLISATNR